MNRRQIPARLMGGVGVAIICALLANPFSTHVGPWRDTMGEVVDCEQRQKPFQSDLAHAYIVGYGLQDPRGVTSYGNLVFIADGGRQDVLEYDITAKRMRESSLHRAEPCPGGNCAQFDPRGLTTWDGNLLMAEHQRSQIVSFSIPVARSHGLPMPNLAGLAGPSGIARYHDELLVTDDRPWPAGADSMTPVNLENYRQWIAEKTPRRFGTLYRKGKHGPVVQDAMLIHPTGIAIDEPGALLYVAESDASETRWLIFQRKAHRWERSGVLGVARNPTGIQPLFQGIALWSDRVYAAGPDGIYVFLRSGRSMGKLSLDEPPAGLTIIVSGRSASLYFAVGHRLCMIPL
jgi:hypothetical protein